MLDAAIGPRLDANSFRIRRVFSAAGTFEVTFASVSATAFSDVSPSSWPGVRDTVLKLESRAGACCAVKNVRCPVYQTIRCGAGTAKTYDEKETLHFLRVRRDSLLGKLDSPGTKSSARPGHNRGRHGPSRQPSWPPFPRFRRGRSGTLRPAGAPDPVPSRTDSPLLQGSELGFQPGDLGEHGQAKALSGHRIDVGPIGRRWASHGCDISPCESADRPADCLQGFSIFGFPGCSVFHGSSIPRGCVKSIAPSCLCG